MKKLIFPFFIILASFATSCEDSADATQEVLELELEADASLESNFEDVDQIVDESLSTIGNLDAGRLGEWTLIDCAVVTKDTVNKVMTVAYGDSCSVDGKSITGTLVIEYSDWRYMPGAYRKVTFEDFSIDDVQIEGVRTLTNTSESTEVNPEFTITLDQGKLTFPDGTIATKNSSRVRVWERGANPLNDAWYVEGASEGTRRDGISYNVEIIERLVFKRQCRITGAKVPVAGVKEITYDGNTILVDYGDGRCDNVVTVSINGGEPFEHVINPRRLL